MAVHRLYAPSSLARKVIPRAAACRDTPRAIFGDSRGSNRAQTLAVCRPGQRKRSAQTDAVRRSRRDPDGLEALPAHRGGAYRTDGADRICAARRVQRAEGHVLPPLGGARVLKVAASNGNAAGTAAAEFRPKRGASTGARFPAAARKVHRRSRVYAPRRPNQTRRTWFWPG